jgi:hypothetical protein
MKTEINTSALFYKGKLFQVGDLVHTKVEYLNTQAGGFRHRVSSGVITKIIISTETVCNSLFLNHGFTYTAIGGLGYRFEIDGKGSVYAFETSLVPFPSRVRDIERYISDYYCSDINKDKLESLVDFISIPPGIHRTLGGFLRKNHKELYDYICLTFKIRQGAYGVLHDTNDMSTITMEHLYKIGYTDNSNNLLYRFTSGNSRTPEGNARYKGIDS